MNEKILESLHTQFAENQNHHQGIFIQFLIALFVLFSGFGYVYTYTNPNIAYEQTFVEKINDIEYFSLITLLSTSAIVIAVLTLLNAILLNLGYGFRRDQHLNMIIRKKYLINEEYKNIFGTLYNSDNKSFCNFLPNFYSIFFWFIFGFQIFIFVAICCKEKVLDIDGKCFSLFILLLDIFLILISLCLYCKTYCKYKNNLKEK